MCAHRNVIGEKRRGKMLKRPQKRPLSVFGKYVSNRLWEVGEEEVMRERRRRKGQGQGKDEKRSPAPSPPL